jgi:hypothetical protein
VTHQLAVLNVARMKAPLDAPVMAGFVASLDRINALADATPGFVWRMVDEDPADPALAVLGPLPLVNLSVWHDLSILRDYVYRSGHAQVFLRRAEWFEPLGLATAVLWWVPAGHRPTLGEAVTRLSLLRAEGPTVSAFTFRSPFAAP